MTEPGQPDNPSEGGKSTASLTVTIPSEHGQMKGKATKASQRTATSAKLNQHSPLPVRQYASDIGLRFSSPARTVSPRRGTPVEATLTNQEVSQIVACRIIERCWMSFRDRQMFKLLKHAICAAEYSLSYEILRKVSPKEAEFFKDPSTQLRVRFRFGGTEFPPLIFFKIFSHSSKQGTSVKYMSGKKVIKPSLEASKNACKLMGNRKFYDQIIQDVIHHEEHKITDELDVTTLKDYMQYLSNLDETPAHMGGRDNLWRKLTLDVLPRQTVFYDVVDYLYNRTLTPRLKAELPYLLTNPITQDIQRRHIEIISEMRPVSIGPMPKSKLAGTKAQLSGRRTKQAKLRAMKMRKMYGLDPEDSSLEIDPELMREETLEGLNSLQGEIRYDEGSEGEDAWEEEAERLYEWTQDLSFEDIVRTPRLPAS